MMRGRTAVVGLWLSIVAVLVIGAVVATTRDGAVDVVAEQGCMPDAIPAPSSPEAPPTTAGVPCMPFPSVVATITTTTTTTTAAAVAPTPTAATIATPSADSDLPFPPGDYDRVAVLKEENDSGGRGRAAAQRFPHMWQVTVVAEGLVAGGTYHFMVGRPGVEWPTPCMFVASRSGRGMCTGRMYGDATPPEMVALMGPSGDVQLSGTFP